MNIDSRQRIIIAGAILVSVLLLSSAIIVLGVDGDNELVPTDAAGNELKLDKIPLKVISTAPSITEQIYSLGFEDRLVAVSSNCDYPYEVLSRLASNGTDKLHSVGSYNNPNVELITELEPDVVFITNTAGGMAVYETLQEAGLYSVMLHQEKDFSEIYKNLDLIQKVLLPWTLIQQQMMETFDEVENIASQGESKKVMMNLGFAWGLESVYTFGPGTFGNSVIEVNNGENAVTGDGFKLVNMEILASDDGNPDIIFAMVQGGYGGVNVTFNETNYQENMTLLKAHAIWGETNAVKNDEVYFFFNRAASMAQRAAPDQADFAKLVCMYMHPEQFPGFDPPMYVGNNYTDLFVGHW